MIGAGLAGITAGALLPAKVPGIQLTILEKNPDVVCQNAHFVNTWSLFKNSCSPEVPALRREELRKANCG